MHEGLRDKASPRRAAVVMAAALLAALVAGPAGAGTGAGHLHSTATNPGTQTHLGRPIHPAQDNSSPPDGDTTDGTDNDACGEFRTHAYEATFPTGKGTVAFGGATFTSFDVAARWAPAPGAVYYAGPRGTYPNSNCQNNQVGASYGPVQATVAGTNAAGQTFTCSANADSTGTFSRNLAGNGEDKLLYTMTSHTCEARNGAVVLANSTTVGITIEVAVKTCNSPITPTVCTSEGRAGTDQTAVTFTGL